MNNYEYPWEVASQFGQQPRLTTAVRRSISSWAARE
jgi:hypothetical protein